EVYKHIINFDENILETEFKLLISNRGSSRIKEQLKNKTTFYKNYYYLGKYFYPILGKSSRETVFKKMKNKFLEKKSYEEDKLFVEKIEEASICNLESFPFRSTVPNLGNDGFGRKLLNNKNKTVLLSARIILRRIALYRNSETSEKPIFIFRRFNDAWRNSIENVLTEDYKVENEEINDFVNYLEKNYFYTFGRRDVNNLSSALITKEGIQKQDEKIDSSQLDEIKHKANINLFI
ncbi:hypothetical protein, partial [Staphylococcus condimenti]|uniref:hypothetical protein n=1 Tax=Staphylococcus condimenti TaxID=70255 RepID=UPI001A930691